VLVQDYQDDLEQFFRISQLINSSSDPNYVYIRQPKNKYKNYFSNPFSSKKARAVQD
jgi:hypothetical protein